MINITFKKRLEQENNFIKLYKFTCSLPKEQAFMLSYLIDAEDFVENRLRSNPEYFECTNDFIKSLLSGWSDAEINTAQQKLQLDGYIDIVKVNMCGCRQHKFIKLNIEKICELKECVVTPQSESPVIKVDKRAI